MPKTGYWLWKRLEFSTIHPGNEEYSGFRKLWEKGKKELPNAGSHLQAMSRIFPAKSIGNMDEMTYPQYSQKKAKKPEALIGNSQACGLALKNR